ncbi:Transposase [Bacteroidales bacterium Barb4]|nr:Transposase [Bacteroidales bacterium Barb4]
MGRHVSLISNAFERNDPLGERHPSHDTFNRVFSGLDPDLLRQCPQNYSRDLIGLLKVMR